MTAATSPMVYIPNQRDRALSLLPSQFRDNKPVIAALMMAIGEGVQTLEDVIFDLMTGLRFDVATGASLEIWGELVGEIRGDLNDSDYRRFIAARILVNRSSGEAEDLIQIAQTITAESTVYLQAFYPAELIVYVFRQSALSDSVAERVAVMMSQVQPIGVKLQVIEAIGGYLGFSDNPNSTPMPVGLLARNIL